MAYQLRPSENRRESFIRPPVGRSEMIHERNRSKLSSWGPAICISIALFLVLLLGGWGAYQDWQYIRQTELRNEVTRVRSHAERTAGRLERQMTDDGTRRTLSDVAREYWLRDHWARFIPPPDLIYGAVVDDQGMILSHSDLQMEGRRLCSDWNAKPVPDAGPDVYSTDCQNLTTGPKSMDIVVPIQQDQRVVGAYHTGVNQDWMEQQIGAARRRSGTGWAAVIGGIILVVLLSSLSLYTITRRSVLLEDALRQSRTQRLAELNQLMIGLAHEVRNPLNAVRLNLYTADRVFRGEAELEGEEISAMLGESVREIERVDSLMTVLLGYARADAVEISTIDVGREIRSVCQFLGPAFQASGIRLETDVPDVDCLARAGRGQIRQVLLNLLNNAKDAVPSAGGRIRISLERSVKSIQVRISDNGEGIAQEYREKLFSPFFSTKEHGTGLGLALVRSLMERSGGQAECVRAEPGGCEFLMTWPVFRDDDTSRQTTS